ncbi:MAG TPA: hypothetical protein PLI65_09585 [Bacteroidales bacterium]|nr:hypothetical protein [Bacteroidales bacterium]HPR58766.1 hypothetical protein [Bacteroidales bacterium]
MKKLFLLLMSVPVIIYSQRDYSAMLLSHNEVVPDFIVCLSEIR